MIFLTVGTERFSLDRLVQQADGIQERTGEEVCVQLGASPIRPKRCRWSVSLPFPEFRKNLSEARVVIAHAGVGTLVLCAQMGKIPILFPRRRQFREHVDDHQVEFASRMSELGLTLQAGNFEELMAHISQYESRCAALLKNRKTRPRLADALSSCLSKI